MTGIYSIANKGKFYYQIEFEVMQLLASIPTGLEVDVE
jgi:hypothetical protein